MAEALMGLDHHADYQSPVLPPRNELNIYWEYTCKTLWGNNPLVKFNKKVRGYLKLADD